MKRIINILNIVSRPPRALFRFLFKVIPSNIKMQLKFMHTLTFIASIFLIVTATCLYYFCILPVACGVSLLAYSIHGGIGFFILFNIYFNHIFCALTDAGSPPPDKDPSVYFGESIKTVKGQKQKKIMYTLMIQPGVMYRYCKICQTIKPPRAHHCTVSGRCILEFDHYCPWVGRTVGYQNYRYFVLLLGYLFVGSTYYLILTLKVFTNMPVNEIKMA